MYPEGWWTSRWSEDTLAYEHQDWTGRPVQDLITIGGSGGPCAVPQLPVCRVRVKGRLTGSIPIFRQQMMEKTRLSGKQRLFNGVV